MKIRTNDKIVNIVNPSYSKFIGLIKDLTDDYDVESEEIEIVQINSEELIKVLKFVDLLENVEFKINKPIYNAKKIKEEVLHHREKLLNFYNSLTSEDIIEYFTISDFLNVYPLEDLLYLKLADIFSENTKVSNFFNLEEENLALDMNREVVLKSKYNELFDFSQFTEDQINQILIDLD